MDNFLLINRLRVSGELGCDYRLGTGVNIFQGSNSTGKTSLIWFMDFAFGSGTRTEEFISPVREKCEWVYVDLIINNSSYTVKRSIQQPENIYVYPGIYETISELETKQSKVYRRKESKDIDSITSFYFENLNIQPGKVPVSETKVAKFSWRNLMSLIYVAQDKWNGIQAQNNFQPEMKKAVFEILLGIDDKEINRLEEKKRESIKALEEAKTRQSSIKQILDKMERALGSPSSINELNKKIYSLNQEKNELLKTLTVKQESVYLIEERETLALELDDSEDKLSGLKQRLDNMEMVYSENELKLEKNRLLLNAKKVFSELPVTKCPRCLNPLTDTGTDKCFVCGQEYKNKDEEKGYAQNLFLLMDEKKELAKIIQSIKDDMVALDNKKQEITDKLSVLNKKIDHINKEVISPVMKATELINLKLIELNKTLGEAENISASLEQEKVIQQGINDDAVAINENQKAIDNLMKDRLTAAEVKSRFTSIMSKVLTNELNLEEKLVGFDELYTPLFEGGKILFKAGREDINKSKGGKVILGYYTAVLEYSLQFGSYHPRLLLLDTPRQDELDMTIFSKILNYWNQLSSYSKPYQIILTGSEFPANAGRIIAEFHNQQASGDTSKPDKFSVYPIKLL